MVDLIKRVKQETGSYCGPAVIEMMVGHLGKVVTQEQVVEASDAKNSVMREGISLEGLAKGVKRLFPEFEVWEKQGSSVEDLKKLSENGYLVCVDWQGVFTTDEYGDEIWNTKDKIGHWWRKQTKEVFPVGDQGHYCIILDVDTDKGFVRFADPYGHYAGKDRFVAIWEFEERWWDDRFGVDENGKRMVVLEERLMFVIAPKEDSFLETVGMRRV